MRPIYLTAAGIGSAFLGFSVLAQPPAEQPVPAVTVTLTPIATGTADIGRIDIAETLSGISVAAGQPLVSVPARIALTMGQPYKQEDIHFSDSAGALPVRMDVDQPPPGLPLQIRSFSPLRATQGPVTISYAAVVTPSFSPRKPGPSYDLRGTDGGMGGAYFSFLLMPLQSRVVDLRLDWNLGRLPGGARMVSTRGTGDFAGRVAPMEMYSTFFLAGRVVGNPRPESPFQAYWIGKPPFDAAAASDWSTRSFTALENFFREPKAKPYILLMRPYARPRDGGGATRGGFMLEYGVGAMSHTARRIMFTHEMVHHFAGILDGDSNATAWYGEGLAEYYKIRVPLRAGLINIDDAAREIGVMTDAYYTSPSVTVPYAEVGKRRWASGSEQMVPYNRGFMYFTNLNAAIRVHSGGRRSLDDLVLTMLERRRAGQSYDEKSWRALLHAELGAAGEADLDHMQSGQLIVPPADAFGPCFARRETRRPRPEPGMSEDSFLVTPHVVTGLDPDSRAAAAGLREGDAITAFTGVTPRIAHSASNVRLAPTVQITVMREGKPLHFRYSTEGTKIAEYSWVLKGNAPKNCAL